MLSFNVCVLQGQARVVPLHGWHGHFWDSAVDTFLHGHSALLSIL